MDYLIMLERLNAMHGAAGDELPLAELLRELAAPHCDTCEIDTLGNLLAHRKGNGSKLMLTAHMDVPGLVVTHIEDSGELRVGSLGRLSAGNALHSPFRFKNGVCGVVSREEKAAKDGKEPNMQELFMDIGAKSREEAGAKVSVGDTAVSALPVNAMGGRVAAPHASRLCCLALLEAMELLEESENDLYFVFTAQQSLGLRGAKTAAFAVAPDYGLSVDLTPAETLEGRTRSSARLSGGAAIKVMDSSVIAHPEVVSRLEAIALAQHIPFQKDVVSGGESGGAELQVSGSGVRTGGVSIPCRYLSSFVETVDLKDVTAAARLLAAFAETDLEKE